MNPQHQQGYSQGPSPGIRPHGYSGPPMGPHGQAPPVDQPMFNGTNTPPPRPQGPGKMGLTPPQTSTYGTPAMQNGPPMSRPPGPHGDQYRGPAAPSPGERPPPPVNQMANMNISAGSGAGSQQPMGTSPGNYGGQNVQGFNRQHGPPPSSEYNRPGAPPTSQYGGQSLSSEYDRLGAPPTSQYGVQSPSSEYNRPGAPSTSQYGGQSPSSEYNRPGAPPTSQYGGQSAPVSQYGGQAGPPVSQYGGQSPSSEYNRPGAPPTSQYGGQSPSSEYNRPGAPPTSQYGRQTSSNSGGQPNLISGHAAPPGGQQMPSVSQYGGPPPTMQSPVHHGHGVPPPTSQEFASPRVMNGSTAMSSPMNTATSQYGQSNVSGYNQPNVAQYGQQPMVPPSVGSPGMPPGSSHPPPGHMTQHATHPPNSMGNQGFPPMGQQGMSSNQMGQAGVPPSPQAMGQPSMPPGPGFSGPPGMQQQPPRRLDPDQMPSPIQVTQDDKKLRTGVFITSEKGGVPPLVTTDFTAQDQGNCNPRFIRSTMYNVPISSDLLKQSHIPFALSVTPLAKLNKNEHPPPLVNLGELGPVRCNRCKAYMCPFMKFMDGGRKFSCVFCGCSTEVPAEYFAHLDHTGRRIDSFDRPELCLGSYEFVATKEYCKNNKPPNPPAFIFMIDISYNAIKSGFVHLLCSHLKSDILPHLPKEAGAEESEIRVGFITYSNVLHFYNVKGVLAQPQMLVVSDIQDVFVPMIDGFLVKLSESESVIDSLLSQIPQMFAKTRETEIALGPVIQAGMEACKAADCSAKLFIFHTSLPIAEAPGKLTNRDDRKLLGTEKEKTILSPQSNFYTTLGQECVAASCSVDIYLMPNSYIDVATISEVCRMTGGQLHKYSYFQADTDSERFLQDLQNNVKKPIVFDAIMRLRTSTGIRATDFWGNIYMSNTTDVELASLDSDKTINVEIKHDDKLNEQDGAFIQAALLYTSVSGQRRLRIHNLSFNCCSQMADLFRNCELDVLVNVLSKKALKDVLHISPKDIREKLMATCSQILACYRKNCATPSSAGQLILPECMKLLPLYSNCVIKSDALQGAQDVSIDDRSYLMHLVNSMDVVSSNCFFYPRLLPVHDLDPDSKTMPDPIRCSMERFHEDGVYLLDNGLSLFLWLGHNVNSQWVHDVFGVQSLAQIDIDKSELLELENGTSHRLRNLVQMIREERQRHMKLSIVRQRDKLEPWFGHFLVEDKGFNGTASYVDYLCHIHKEIRALLS